MLQEWRQESPPCLRAVCDVVAVHVEPGVDEGADEPRPDRALMIGAIALCDATFATRLVGGIALRKRAQAQRREEFALDGRDDRPRPFVVDQRGRQTAYREDLVRPQA